LQGKSVDACLEKEHRCPFFKPSFFSQPGNIIWTETYKTKIDGELETFLTIEKPFKIVKL
jgi:hypothetical protein